jgi:hypothetical protein
MTLWDRKPGLILVLALFIFACEEPGEIGLNINPENGAFVARYLEIPIESKLVQHRDIISDNTTRIDRSRTSDPFRDVLRGDGRFLVGNLVSPEIGKIQAKACAGLYLSKIGFTGYDAVPAPYIFDSLKMFARVEYLNGNNMVSSQKIMVHELKDTLLIDSLYLTRSSQDYFDDPLGVFDIDLTNFDSTRVDTVFSTRLSDELGQRFMDDVQADTLPFSSNPEFRKYFNGFALVPAESNDVIVGIHAESNATFVRMYFHSAIDTTFLDFIFDNAFTSDGDLLNKYFNRITLDKSGAPTQIITDYYTEYETGDAYSYINGSSGIFTKLDFSPFYNLLDTVEFLIINRAELVTEVKAWQNNMPPSASLDLYATDQSNRFIANTDSVTMQLTYRTLGGVSLDLDSGDNGIYAGNITGFIQGLSDGSVEYSSALVGQGGLWNSVLSVNQTVIEKDKIFLKVYYSSLK